MADFEKAFDSLNWVFLMEVMSCMGFDEKWHKWILACLKSTSISILINGSPTREFSISRGVRQGDPLSPFLFILAAEGLNILTKGTVERGLFNGVEIGRDKIMLSTYDMRMILCSLVNDLDRTPVISSSF
ncbi:secreted RxLR effector protein 78-like [Rutidosis leptorrhynchoides]|uniref:secreted RxLR effector protein 78-like n=1 Tax=Rutidosis leptorrhynchoides TaxID=125765 RepID=UPI003A98E418